MVLGADSEAGFKENHIMITANSACTDDASHVSCSQDPHEALSGDFSMVPTSVIKSSSFGLTRDIDLVTN